MVTVEPVEGLPEFTAGDDLPAVLATALAGRVRPGDVVAVTQKIVSKAEGRAVPEAERGHDGWVASETARVVARRDGLVVAQTRHGFVCANAGVDASNVGEGFLTLLPVDPDASAARIGEALSRAAGGDVGVLVTDTFGRPWRRGLVNVAIGSSGLPALVDLRGGTDHTGRVLEATVVALADELAAASGLVMAKDAMVPVAILRPGDGGSWVGDRGDAAGAVDLVRPPQEDLFRESPLQSLHARRSLRSFGRGEVPVGALEEAVRAACTAPAPHHTRPWLFVALTSDWAKRRLLAAMATAWRADLEGDGAPVDVIERRLARSDTLLGAAPAIVVPLVRLRGSHAYPDDERAAAEREMFLLAGGAGIQNLLLALHAQGLGSCWVSSTLFCKEETRTALGVGDEWIPLGAVAVGPMPPDAPSDRPPLDVGGHLRVH
ncbi:MAG TPA: coenzyme F420-0:L-glutamate ligase [Actinomycetota bacterium]|jgi:coenzyme F420-0:L-glutamate ligase/coenzyme F420-1:gamma-L-glutamate ligase